MSEQNGLKPVVAGLIPHPVTAPWCGSGGPGTLFSWECAFPRGSSCGITDTEHKAMRAVTEALRAHGGEGLVQRCVSGWQATVDERDQYGYGDVIARARAENDVVVWAVP